MSKSIFVIGGCRSGKSRHAMKLADAVGGKKVFIATCVPQDEEMNQRVAHHRSERGGGWETVEAPLDLAAAIADGAKRADVVLADCLTLWASNLLLAETDPENSHIIAALSELVSAIDEAACPVILVSNEVGAGIVPENRLARLFRDEVGRINQQVAAAVDQVIWMVAGIPMTIKPERAP
ncbi:MAG: bifunctional adenosylcobinamide kinase/adenosylcobinamide-phosphate guanylyltransferase [Desulfobacterales bacterium]|nr:bifunctional adenosylcobinamide kinase/adenosylcobinamide-phosphate guanylyltransferase [Desulfobacterales bacterium]